MHASHSAGGADADFFRTIASERGQFLFAEESSHMLHVDAEELVVDSILSMMADQRGAGAAQMRP